MNTIAYAAGLFDGEGTVSLMRQSSKQRRCPVVSLSSTTRELVDFMYDTFGGVVTKAPKQQAHWKDAWHWQASHNRALEVLAQLMPYMREPEKRRRAALLVERYKSVTPRNGKYTDDLNVAREAFESEFFRSQ